MSFLSDAGEQAVLKSKDPAVFVQLTLFSNLLFQLSTEELLAGRGQKGSLLIPAAWNKAGDTQMLHHPWLKCRSCCSIRTRGLRYLMGLWLHLMTEPGQHRRLRTTGIGENHWQWPGPNTSSSTRQQHSHREKHVPLCNRVHYNISYREQGLCNTTLWHLFCGAECPPARPRRETFSLRSHN